MLRRVARGPKLGLGGVAVFGEWGAVVCEDAGAFGGGIFSKYFGRWRDMKIKKRG